jgi:y4mF family transcriptional regulator
MQEQHIASFVKYQRNKLKMTQEELAEKAGVGLRFIRELEQGKETLRMDKVNQVLQLFGHTLSAKPQRILDPYKILLHHFNKNVQVHLRNKKVLSGFLVDVIHEGTEVKAWKFVSNNNAQEYQKTKNGGLEQILNHTDIESVENS